MFFIHKYSLISWPTANPHATTLFLPCSHIVKTNYHGQALNKQTFGASQTPLFQPIQDQVDHDYVYMARQIEKSSTTFHDDWQVNLLKEKILISYVPQPQNILHLIFFILQPLPMTNPNPSLYEAKLLISMSKTIACHIHSFSNMSKTTLFKRKEISISNLQPTTNISIYFFFFFWVKMLPKLMCACFSKYYFDVCSSLLQGYTHN